MAERKTLAGLPYRRYVQLLLGRHIVFLETGKWSRCCRQDWRKTTRRSNKLMVACFGTRRILEYAQELLLQTASWNVGTIVIHWQIYVNAHTRRRVPLRLSVRPAPWGNQSYSAGTGIGRCSKGLLSPCAPSDNESLHRHHQMLRCCDLRSPASPRDIDLPSRTVQLAGPRMDRKQTTIRKSSMHQSSSGDDCRLDLSLSP